MAKVKSELAGAERRVREKESEFEHFRQQLDLKPEVRLQAQINVLTLEKVSAWDGLDEHFFYKSAFSVFENLTAFEINQLNTKMFL